MVKFLLSCMLFPSFLCFSIHKQDLIHEVALAFHNADFEMARNFSIQWAKNFEEDVIPAMACLSLSLCGEKKLPAANLVYQRVLFLMESQKFPSNVQQRYKKTMELALNNHDQLLEDSYIVPELEPCKFSLKFKAVAGALIFTAGLFTTPFNPGIGTGLMTTGGGMILDSTLGYKDEFDEQDRRKREKLRESDPENDQLNVQ